jgi:ComF family protein
MDWSFLSTKKISQVYYQHFCNQCYFCKIKSNQLICKHCLNGFTFNHSHCKTCKLPTPTQVERCGQCQKKPPQYDILISPLVYSGLTKALILNLKFSSHYHACHPLCQLLADALKHTYQDSDMEEWPDILIPTPSHIERVRERGFCHMTLLSNHLLAYLPKEIPIGTQLLLKAQHLAPQHELNKKQRHTLKASSFACPKTIPNHVALFDDVVTTGSTIDACITKLKEAGAKRVDVWSLARTPPNDVRID